MVAMSFINLPEIQVSGNSNIYPISVKLSDEKRLINMSEYRGEIEAIFGDD